jgi:hypothetical protein
MVRLRALSAGPRPAPGPRPPREKTLTAAAALGYKSMFKPFPRAGPAMGLPGAPPGPGALEAT